MTPGSWLRWCRAHSALKDNTAALTIVDELGKLAKDSITERLDLGKALVSSGDDMVAAVVYGQILAADPGNLTAQLGMAQVQIHQYQPEAACATLSGIKPTAALCRQWALVWAEYHQLVGEDVEARQRYTILLAKDPLDTEARLALAKLLEYIQEYEKAKAEYTKVPPAGGRGRQARQGFADTLYDQRRFAESIECCERLLAEDPADGEAVARLMRRPHQGWGLQPGRIGGPRLPGQICLSRASHRSRATRPRSGAPGMRPICRRRAGIRVPAGQADRPHARSLVRSGPRPGQAQRIR